jgi:hypothetical protein
MSHTQERGRSLVTRTRRRWGLLLQGEHHRAPRSEAIQAHQLTEPGEHRYGLANGNGGAAALAHGSRPFRPRDGAERVLQHRRAKAKEMRATRRKKVEQRGVVHGAKLSSELGRALASDFHGRSPYHGKPRRAWDARGGGGARSEM